MGRDKHPKKDVEKALQYAEEHGWTIEPKKKKGHNWGRAWCPEREDSAWIFSTPRNPGDHANFIRRSVIRCPHNQT